MAENAIDISILKDGEKEITDSVKKAKVQSSQYKSVFTEEKLTTMPTITKRLSSFNDLLLDSVKKTNMCNKWGR